MSADTLLAALPVTTARTVLRAVSMDSDVDFILQLFQEPGVVRGIGDRGMRTADDARQYIEERIVDTYRRHGYGPFAVCLQSSGAPIGIVGLLNRDWLRCPDIGFCFLDAHTNQGYGYETASAVLALCDGRVDGEIGAIVSPDNVASKKLLARLGFVAGGQVRTPNGEDIDYFSLVRSTAKTPV